MSKQWVALALMILMAGCRRPTGAPEPLTSFPDLQPPITYIPMRDGVKLAATFSWPGFPSKKFPAVLIRTPYGRGDSRPDLTRLGYVVISEDVRGRGASGGKWEPFLNEKNDGYDTIEWISRQPWFDGHVGMVGDGYLAYAQWAAAAAHPPSLKCMIPVDSPPDPFQNFPYENGCLLEAFDLWYMTITDSSLSASKAPDKPKYDAWPVIEADKAVNGDKSEVYRRWVEMDQPGDWKRGETIEDARRFDVPSLSISGWFDENQIGTQLRWESRSAKCKNQWLVFGPWGHTQTPVSRLGDISVESSNGPDIANLEYKFLARWLKGDRKALEGIPRVQAFMLGRNEWVSDSQWPLGRASKRRLYLAPFGLGPDKPSVAGSRSFDYDPMHVRLPRPLIRDPLDDMLPYRLTAIDLPYGNLLYRTAPLTRPTVVTGPASIALTFGSTAKDTDFFAQLFDESPDGSLLPIGQAAKFRVKAYVTKGADMKPNAIYSAMAPFWESLFQVATGHRITLMISSDRFPSYALNSNGGEPLAQANRTFAARQTVWSGGDKPSYIEIGILE